MKIENKPTEFDDCKRFPIPGTVTDRCPECGIEIEKSGADGDYLSYPESDVAFGLHFYCDECSHEWRRSVILRVALEAVPGVD